MVERTFNHAKIVASVARAAGDPEDGISVKLIDARGVARRRWPTPSISTSRRRT